MSRYFRRLARSTGLRRTAVPEKAPKTSGTATATAPRPSPGIELSEVLPVRPAAVAPPAGRQLDAPEAAAGSGPRGGAAAAPEPSTPVEPPGEPQTPIGGSKGRLELPTAEEPAASASGPPAPGATAEPDNQGAGRPALPPPPQEPPAPPARAAVEPTDVAEAAAAPAPPRSARSAGPVRGQPPRQAASDEPPDAPPAAGSARIATEPEPAPATAPARPLFVVEASATTSEEEAGVPVAAAPQVLPRPARQAPALDHAPTVLPPTARGPVSGGVEERIEVRIGKVSLQLDTPPPPPPVPTRASRPAAQRPTFNPRRHYLRGW